jgi:MscS family membrane protein
LFLALGGLVAGVGSSALGAEAPAKGPAAEAAPEKDAPEQAEPAAEPAPEKEPPPKIDLSQDVPAWAREEVIGVAVWQAIAAFVFILVGLVLRKVSDYLFASKIVPLLRRTPYALDELLAEAAASPVGVLLLLLGFGGAFAVLPLPVDPDVQGFVYGLLKLLVAGDVLWFLFRLVDVGSQYLVRLAGKTDSKLDDQLIPVIRKALKATVGVIGFVWVVQLLGYSVSSLIAGLGIGGLAVALALQDTLANFFGSVFIFLDRPFTVGDWIRVDDVEGIVEDIGFRSTRIRTWPATLVAIPNKNMANATVDNWSKMPKRRVMQTVGVTYETTADQMEQAVEGIRDIVENDEGVDKEFIVVRFTDFGDSSLNILVYYFTTAIPFADHTETKQRINLAIMRLLRGMGLSIAFPTRTLYFEGPVAENLVERLGGPAQNRGADREES